MRSGTVRMPRPACSDILTIYGSSPAGLPQRAATSEVLALVAMRWLLIAFLVSLGALLLAAAGVARHIWRHRAQARHNRAVLLDPAAEVGEEVNIEVEL